MQMRPSAKAALVVVEQLGQGSFFQEAVALTTVVMAVLRCDAVLTEAITGSAEWQELNEKLAQV